MAIPATQQQYELIKQAQGFSLRKDDQAPLRAPADNEVLVRVRASSLNRRDLAILRGAYPVGSKEKLVPLSDGAGEVAAIGARVTRFKVGDRVAAAFFQNWLAGRASAMTATSALGGALNGMLAQYVILGEEGLVALPADLTFEEAAALPCAGVTAWAGLMRCGRLQAGDTALLQGTGGVSVLGMQIAMAAGAKIYVTSSSDAKLQRALALGASGLINYKATPDWEKSLREQTGGVGVNHILEVGGSGTLPKSLAAASSGAHIALIGGLSGFGGDLPAAALIGRNISVTGIFVGSRADFSDLLAFVARHRIKPVLDRCFEFADAAAAYAYMESASHFGKIVIRH